MAISRESVVKVVKRGPDMARTIQKVNFLKEKTNTIDRRYNANMRTKEKIESIIPTLFSFLALAFLIA